MGFISQGEKMKQEITSVRTSFLFAPISKLGKRNTIEGREVLRPDARALKLRYFAFSRVLSFAPFVAGEKEPPIGVGKTAHVRSPLPPNRTGGSPASGSPVGSITLKGIDRQRDGRLPN